METSKYKRPEGDGRRSEHTKMRLVGRSRHVVGLGLLIVALVLAACGTGAEGPDESEADIDSAIDDAEDVDEPDDADEAPEAEGDEETDSGDAVTLRVGHVLGSDHPWNQGLELTRDRVAELTDGAVQMEIFPDATLGAERDLAEGVELGTIEMALVSTAVSAGIEPTSGIVELPYIIEDFDHAAEVLDGEVGERISQNFQDELGIQVLSYYFQGFRNVFGNRPISEMSDLDGFRIRIPEAPTYIRTFELLGANPTPIPFNEVYTAVESGVVDGMEGSAETMVTSNIAEVASHYSLTNHIFGAVILMINQDVFDSLSDEHRAALLEAAADGTELERQLVLETEADAVERLEEQGVTVTEPDLDAFREAVAPFYAEYAADLGEDGARLIDLVRDAGS